MSKNKLFYYHQLCLLRELKLLRLLKDPLCIGRLYFQCFPKSSTGFLQFEGGVVVISHDSQLLSVVCDDEERSEVWLVEDGKVERYDGYFQDYKDELTKEISDEMDEEEVYQRPDAILT